MSYYPTERRGGCMESINRCCRQAYVYPLDTRKLLFIGGGVVGVILVAVIWSSLSSSGSDSKPSGSSILKQHPFAVGCNFFSSNVRDLVHNQVSKINFQNTTSVANVTCSSCQTDLTRLQKGSVSIQLWSIDVPCEAMYEDAVALTLEQLDAMTRLISSHSTATSSVTTTSEIQQNFNNKLLSSVLAVNSGHSIDGRLAVLRMFHKLGVQVMGLTSNCSTDWATSYNNKADNGLSPFGLEVVKEMNRLGMVVDLSESSHKTQLDVLSNTTVDVPVIFTHTAAFNLSSDPRNIRDDVLEILSKRPAIVMVTFAQNYLNNTSNNASIDTVIEHLNHLKNKVGPNKVGIGGEFDRQSLKYPPTLSDVSKFPTLFDKLKSEGWTTDELINLAGGNFLRVLKQVEQYAASRASDAVDEQYQLENNHSCYSDFDTRNGKANTSLTTTDSPTTTPSAVVTETTVPTTTPTTPTVPTTTPTVPTTTPTKVTTVPPPTIKTTTTPPHHVT